MLRRITIFGVLAAIALAAIAATSPSVIRRFSGDILVEGEVYGFKDLWFDETTSVKSALTNHTHDASKIVSGTIGTARLGSGTPSSTTFLRGDSTWAELSGGGDADTLNGQAGSWYLARSNHTGTQVLATISDAGTAAARNVPSSGNAGATEAVLGNDTRLSDARTPTSHAHAGADITSGTVGTARLGSGTPSSSTFLRGDGTWAELSGGGDADTLGGQAGSWYLARSNHTGTQVLATISDAGTAAARNVPSSGNAGSTEAVLGNDTRLSDSRTPTSHAHAGADITSGTVGTARLGSGTPSSSTFLRGDGTWAELSGGGDADTLNGQAGSWYLARSNHTGTQVLATISDAGTAAARNVPSSGNAGATEAVLGNDTRLSDSRTPTSHNHAGGDITSGLIGTAHLGSGTAGSTKVLTGSQAWTQLTTEWIANITDHGRDIVESIDPATSRSVIGAAATSHSHAGGDITSGTVGAARLGTGTPSSSTFLRGDGTWAEPSMSGYLPLGASTNNPLGGDLVIKAGDVPSLFFGDSDSGTGGAISFVEGNWFIGSAAYGAPDYGIDPWLLIDSAGEVNIPNGLQVGGGAFVEGKLSTAKLVLATAVETNAPAAGEVRFFLRQNGSGKGELCVRFPTGATQILATEP
jgi:hypothetical protein